MRKKPKVRRWRVTEPSGRVWFVYARTKLEVVDRLVRSRVLRSEISELAFEVVPLEREKVVRGGRDA